MIKIQDETVEIQTENTVELLAEASAIVETVAKEVSATTEMTEDEIIGDIFGSIKFSRLVKSGLTKEEAFKIMEETIHHPEPDAELEMETPKA